MRKVGLLLILTGTTPDLTADLELSPLDRDPERAGWLMVVVLLHVAANYGQYSTGVLMKHYLVIHTAS